MLTYNIFKKGNWLNIDTLHCADADQTTTSMSQLLYTRSSLNASALSAQKKRSRKHKVKNICCSIWFVKKKTVHVPHIITLCSPFCVLHLNTSLQNNLYSPLIPSYQISTFHGKLSPVGQHFLTSKLSCLWWTESNSSRRASEERSCVQTN